jgi:hypothetical protein
MWYLGFVLIASAILISSPLFYQEYSIRVGEYRSCLSYEGRCIIFLSQCREVVRVHPLQWTLMWIICPHPTPYASVQYASFLMVVGGVVHFVVTVRKWLKKRAIERREIYLYETYGGEKHRRRQRQLSQQLECL